jgi:hypothetical protein
MSTFTGARQGTDNLALATGYGIIDRDFRKDLQMKVPKYKALSIFRQMEGRLAPMEMTKNHEYYFWEEGDWFNASAGIALTDTSTPNVVVVTLASEDHYSSGTKSYPILNQLAVFEDETVGFVSAINRTVDSAHTVTIKRLNSDQDVQAAAVIGTKVVFYGSVFGEASDTPETRVPYVSQVTNYIHTSRHAYKVTDWSAQNETEFEFNGQRFLYVKGLEECSDRFSLEEELNLLITPLAASLTDASSNSLKTANALIPQIGSNGQNVEYIDEPDLAFQQDTVLTIDANYGDDEYFVGQGRNVSLANDNWLKDFASGGDNRISFSAFDGGKEQALSFDFKSISLGGVTMHYDTWNVLSHAQSLGAGDMPYRHMQVMIPAGMGLDEHRNSVPYLRMRYAKPQGAPHEVQEDVKVFEHGGASRRGATDGVQQRIVEMISYKSLEIRNREKFLIARKGNL